MVFPRIFLMVPLLVVGCGGGGGSDSGGKNSAGSNSGGSTNVAGEFKFSTATGVFAPIDRAGGNPAACANGEGYDRYFESENTLVFANSNKVTDDDYRYAATVVENNFKNVLNAMGLTIQEFQEFRPAYTEYARNLMFLRFPDFSYSADEVDPASPLLLSRDEYPDKFPSQSVLEGLQTAYWNSLSRSEQIRLVNIYVNKQWSPEFESERFNKGLIPLKVVVCLDVTRTNSNYYGQGGVAGIEMAPKSVVTRKDSDLVIIHELVHMVQANVAVPEESAVYLDRWFAEGQAVAIAGQAIAKNNAGYNATEVISFFDENYSVVKYPYEHYGLAYTYLSKYNNKNAMLNFLKNIRTNENRYFNDWVVNTVSDDKSWIPFFEAFEQSLVGADGRPLSLTYFRENYLNIVK